MILKLVFKQNDGFTFKLGKLKIIMLFLIRVNIKHQLIKE